MKNTDEEIWKAQPFITCTSEPGKSYRVTIECATLQQAQDIHEAIADNAIARKKWAETVGSTTVPRNETMRQKLDRLESGRGGWTKKALAELGIAWPPKKGWRKALLAANS